MIIRSLAFSRGVVASRRFASSAVVVAIGVVSAVVHGPVLAATVAGSDPSLISPAPLAKRASDQGQSIQIADSSNNKGLLGGLFSLFKKKPKRRPAQRIIIRNNRLQNNRQGVIIRRRGQGGRIVVTPSGGRRIFNPFIPNQPSAVRAEAPKQSFRVRRRTMCVRLCDGYYWPMRSNGSNNSLQRDAQTCESSCKSASRLFVLNTSTDNIARMRDLGGRSYGKLKNAFKYRKTFNPSCRCKPEPWSQRARLRHKRYAAVGKERRVLAMRSVALDLRRTLQPTKDAARVAGTRVTGAEFWDPTLPARKPRSIAFVDKHVPGSLAPRRVATVLAANDNGIKLPGLRLRSAVAVLPTAHVTMAPRHKPGGVAVPGLRSRYSARRAVRFNLSGRVKTFRSRAGFRRAESRSVTDRFSSPRQQSLRPGSVPSQSIFRKSVVPFALPAAASRGVTR